MHVSGSINLDLSASFIHSLIDLHWMKKTPSFIAMAVEKDPFIIQAYKSMQSGQVCLGSEV